MSRWLPLLLLLGAAFLARMGLGQGLPTLAQVRTSFARSDAILVDRHGQVLQEWRVDPKSRRLSWVELSAISPALVRFVLDAEDRRFYSHGGVDWRAALAALWARVRHHSLRGASTLSMQLAAFLDPSARSRARRRGWWQKWRQMEVAWRLEKEWTKPQILEAYFNLVSFRGELQGIQAASQGLFRKDPHGLDASESAILAALLRAPNASPAGVSARACRLWTSVKRTPCGDVEAKAVEIVSRPYRIVAKDRLAPHVAARLLGGRGFSSQRVVKTTLDAGLQRFAQEVLRQHLLSLRSQNVSEGAVLVVENATGNVLAYVGNSGDVPGEAYVDGVTARRQAGSTLKPFLYGLAFQRRVLTPASLLDDCPLDVSVSRGVYHPGNYDNLFHGWVSARTALASSLNVPAVKTLLLVGPDALVGLLEKAGITGLKNGDFYGPSLALGTADVTLWDMVGAYRTLANGGLWTPLHLTPEEGISAPPRRALSEGAAALVSDILSDRDSRSLTFGLESPLSRPFWAAVKTGTSKDMRDNWCFGFSRRYTVGVWVGNFGGEPMWNVSGISGAAPVWAELISRLERGHTKKDVRLPSGVVARTVRVEPGGEQYRELFLRGTEEAVVAPRQALPGSRILQPASDSIVAVDPDIPRSSQRLLFEAATSDPKAVFRLNGATLGIAREAISWEPRPGHYALELVGAKGEVLDRLRFQVRGAADASESNGR